MKKFELYSAEFVSKYKKPKCVMSIIEANSLADLIQEIESNAGTVYTLVSFNLPFFKSFNIIFVRYYIS